MVIVVLTMCDSTFSQYIAKNIQNTPTRLLKVCIFYSLYFNIVFKFATKFSLVFISFINIFVTFSFVFIL